jgi:hypothetical protein
MNGELDRLKAKLDKLDRPAAEVVELPNPLKKRA